MFMQKFLGLVYFLFFISLLSYGQQIDLTYSVFTVQQYSVSNSNHSITITNNTTSTIDSIKYNVLLPIGIGYEFPTSLPAGLKIEEGVKINEFVFTVYNLSPAASVSLDYTPLAGCLSTSGSQTATINNLMVEPSLPFANNVQGAFNVISNIHGELSFLSNDGSNEYINYPPSTTWIKLPYWNITNSFIGDHFSRSYIFKSNDSRFPNVTPGTEVGYSGNIFFSAKANAGHRIDSIAIYVGDIENISTRSGYTRYMSVVGDTLDDFIVIPADKVVEVREYVSVIGCLEYANNNSSFPRGGNTDVYIKWGYSSKDSCGSFSRTQVIQKDPTRKSVIEITNDPNGMQGCSFGTTQKKIYWIKNIGNESTSKIIYRLDNSKNVFSYSKGSTLKMYDKNNQMYTFSNLEFGGYGWNTFQNCTTGLLDSVFAGDIKSIDYQLAPGDSVRIEYDEVNCCVPDTFDISTFFPYNNEIQFFDNDVDFAFNTDCSVPHPIQKPGPNRFSINKQKLLIQPYPATIGPGTFFDAVYEGVNPPLFSNTGLFSPTLFDTSNTYVYATVELSDGLSLYDASNGTPSFIVETIYGNFPFQVLNAAATGNDHYVRGDEETWVFRIKSTDLYKVYSGASSFPNMLNLLEKGSVNVKIYSHCTNMGKSNFKLTFSLAPGNITQMCGCDIPFATRGSSIAVMCPGCVTPGAFFVSVPGSGKIVDVKRLNLGLRDDDDNGLADIAEGKALIEDRRNDLYFTLGDTMVTRLNIAISDGDDTKSKGFTYNTLVTQSSLGHLDNFFLEYPGYPGDKMELIGAWFELNGIRKQVFDIDPTSKVKFHVTAQDFGLPGFTPSTFSDFIFSDTSRIVTNLSDDIGENPEWNYYGYFSDVSPSTGTDIITYLADPNHVSILPISQNMSLLPSGLQYFCEASAVNIRYVPYYELYFQELLDFDNTKNPCVKSLFTHYRTTHDNEEYPGNIASVSYNYFPYEFRTYRMPDSLVQVFPGGYALRNSVPLPNANQLKAIHPYYNYQTETALIGVMKVFNYKGYVGYPGLANSIQRDSAFILNSYSATNSTLSFKVPSLGFMSDYIKGIGPDTSESKKLVYLDETSSIIYNFRMIPDCNESVNTIEKDSTFLSNFKFQSKYNGLNITSKKDFRGRFTKPKVGLLLDYSNGNSFVVDNDTTYLNLDLKNINNSDNNLVLAPNVFIRPSSLPIGINIVAVKRNGVLISPDGNGFFRLGDVLPGVQEQIQLVTTYTCPVGCDPSAPTPCLQNAPIDLYYGWNCDGYPTSLTNTCGIDTTRILITTVRAGLQIKEILYSLSGNPTLGICDTLAYKIQLNSLYQGRIKNFDIVLSKPSSLNFIGVQNNTVLPSLVTTNSVVFEKLYPDGINVFTPKDSIILLFTAGCNYKADTLNVNIKGTTYCGTELDINYKKYTPPLLVSNSPIDSISIGVECQPIDLGQTTIRINYINNRSSNTLYNNKVVFNVPYPFDYISNTSAFPVLVMADHVEFTLPTLTADQTGFIDVLIGTNTSLACDTTFTMLATLQTNYIKSCGGDNCSILVKEVKDSCTSLVLNNTMTTLMTTDTMCLGESVVLNASVTGGNAQAMYTWYKIVGGVRSLLSGPTTSNTYIYTNFLETTVFEVEANNGGCPKTARDTVVLGDVDYCCTYKLGDISVACSTTPKAICIPLIAVRNVPAGIIGMDFCLKYDPTVMQYTGNSGATSSSLGVGPVVTNNGIYSANYAAYNDAINGVLRVSIYYTGGGAGTASFSGMGEVICLNFNVLPNSSSAGGVYPINMCTVDDLQEAYTLYERAACWKPGSLTINYSDRYKAQLRNPLYTNLITGIGAVFPGKATTTITPVGEDCDLLNAITGYDYVGSNIDVPMGGFSKLKILREVDGTYTNARADYQLVVNAADTRKMHRITTMDPVLVNTNIAARQVHWYSMVAADVNMNGAIRANDITLVQERVVAKRNEYPQVWNYGNSLSVPSLDWRFVEESRVNTDPSFQRSTVYPSPDGSGYERQRVPSVPMCMDVEQQCEGTPLAVIYGVMLGDVERTNEGIKPGYFTGYLRTTSKDSSSITVDVSRAQYLGKNVYRVPVIHQYNYEYDDHLYGIDMFMDYDQEKLRINDVLYAGTTTDGGVSMMWNNADEDQFILTSYTTVDSIAAKGISYFLDIEKYTNEPFKKEDFGFLQFLLNGEKVAARVITGELATGVNDVQVSITPHITVIPNPAVGEAMIEFAVSNNSNNNRLVITDVLGRIVKSYDRIAEYGTIDLNTADLAAGMYICTIRGENGFVLTEKFQVRK